MDKRQSGLSRARCGRVQTSGGEARGGLTRVKQCGMGREQMCSFVRVINMSHSSLKTTEGHIGLGRKKATRQEK